MSTPARRGALGRLQRITGHLGARNTAKLQVSANDTWSNWAGIVTCEPKYYHEPQTEKEIKDILSRATAAGEKVRVVGTGHSPNDMAICKDHMINLVRYNQILKVDRTKHTALVEAGCTLNQLNEALWSKGLSLSSLGSISDQQIGGVISTGTHGTGDRFGIVSTTVLHLTLITATGEVLFCSKDENPEIYKAALCGLGSIGVLSTLCIQCEPRFYLKEVNKPHTLKHVLDNLDSLMGQADHSRFWWFPHTDKVVVTHLSRTAEEPEPPSLFRDLRRFKEKLVRFHLLQFLFFCGRYVPSFIPWINSTYHGVLAANNTPVVERSFEGFNFDCLFQHYVTEWSIPRERCAEALQTLKAFIDDPKNQMFVHFPVEVRFVKQDDIWLSAAYGRDSCYIGIMMYRPYGYDVEYKKYFDNFERIMWKLDGRPHWAKTFSLRSADFRALYPKWDDFLRVRESLDPQKLFWNDYTNRIFTDPV